MPAPRTPPLPATGVQKLRGLTEIAAHLRVGREKVLEWIQDPNSGIPVTRFSEKGPYFANAADLDWFWLKLTARKGTRK